MTSVAVVVPVRSGEPATGSLEAVSEGLDAARDPSQVRVLVMGGDAAQGAQSLAEAGFGDLATLLCEAPTFAPARLAEALADLVAADDLVLVPASNDGRDLAPRLAARLDRPLLAGVHAVSAGAAVVPRAGGASLHEVTFLGPVVATLQPTARGVAVRTVGPAVAPVQVPAFAAFAASSDVEVLEVIPPEAATMDLTEASFIVGAGAGVGTAERFAQLESVAVALGASTGATRVVTDAGWTGHDRQIGTTGVVVDPDCYVAFGVSGAVQHTSGLGDPGHVISVNLDPHCPMASLADLAIVADVPAVVAALARRIDATGDDR